MNSTLRTKIYPKSRHFGFKRPVFFDTAEVAENKDNEEKKDDQENKGTNEEKEDLENETNKKPENQVENQAPPKQNNIHLLSFSISTDLLSIHESPSTPGFDWIHESESKEKLYNEPSFFFDEPDLNKGINYYLDGPSLF